jgi:CheY-like chemotaxis protein
MARCFHLRLPMTKFRILQIDDDPVMRDLVEAVLAREEHLVVQSCDGGEAGLAICAQWRPDLILCDVVMSPLSGPDVLARLRQNPSTVEIPIIFTTGRAQPDEVANLIWLGAAAVIVKPFGLQELAKTLCDHLDVVSVAPAGIEITPVPYDFRARLRNDAEIIGQSRHSLIADRSLKEEVRSCIHKLAGTAAMYGFEPVSVAAAAAEKVVLDWREGGRPVEDVRNALDELHNIICREVGSLTNA